MNLGADGGGRSVAEGDETSDGRGGEKWKDAEGKDGRTSIGE